MKRYKAEPHSPTLTSLHLRQSLFSNSFAALPMSQLILQPLRCFTYVIGTSPTSPSEPPLPLWWCLLYPWWFCNLQWLRPAGLYERRKLALELKRLKTPVLQALRYTRISELHDVANLPYIDELLEDRVDKMFQTISTHDNPVVRSMGHLYQWCAKHRNIFQELCNSEEALIRQIE